MRNFEILEDILISHLVLYQRPKTYEELISCVDSYVKELADSKVFSYHFINAAKISYSHLWFLYSSYNYEIIDFERKEYDSYEKEKG